VLRRNLRGSKKVSIVSYEDGYTYNLGFYTQIRGLLWIFSRCGGVRRLDMHSGLCWRSS